MWLLPYAKLSFSSQAEADEVLSSIKEHSVPSELFNLIPPKGKHYFSSFMGHRFTLHENSLPFLFPCVITGDVVSFGFETTVKVSIRPGWFFIFVLIMIFVLVALIGAEVYLAYTKPINEMPSYGLQALPVVLYVLLLLAFRWKIIKHRNLLMTILIADKVS